MPLDGTTGTGGLPFNETAGPVKLVSLIFVWHIYVHHSSLSIYSRKLQMIEMRMLALARSKTRKDHIRNVDFWREAKMKPMTSLLRQTRLSWYDQSVRKEGEPGEVTLIKNLNVQGKRRTGRPEKRQIQHQGEQERWQRTWWTIEMFGT